MENTGKKNSVYVNRELSWLKFNLRVLEEAEDPGVPLFERLRFVSIFASNLDEFYMVRVGSLFDQLVLKKPVLDSKTGMSSEEQLEAIFDQTKLILPRKDQAYARILSELSDYRVHPITPYELSDEDYEYLSTYFEKEVLPLTSPQIIDKHHPFPFLKSKELYIGVHIAGKNENAVRLGIIPASGSFSRVIFLPSRDGVRFMLVEDLLCLFADRIFFKHKIIDKTVFRITRNADLNVEDSTYDFDLDYREAMTELLKKRKKLAPVRLELRDAVNVNMMNYLCEHLELSHQQVFINHSPLDFSFVSALEGRLQKERELFFSPLTPQKSPYINPEERLIPQIQRRDILLHYPYHSIDPFIRLLNEAAEDPKVVSIQITLYRVAKDSKVVSALIKAAENGKEVKAVVELRARFDEENNIDWSKQMEEAGVSVIYGLDEYKVHSKLLLITRKSGNHIEYITQIGTGNYNEKTAKLYTDLCLMTANKEIGADASVVFNSLFMGNMVESSNHLLVAPLCFKSRIIELIDNEIAVAKLGQPALIQLKMNSVSDRVLIDKLIEASKAGVQVKMIVRGILCMRTGVEGQTENIKAISIVGRFLEHSRIYVFGAEERRKVYIASADFMTRNTERRVEVAAPVYDKRLQKELLDVMEVMFRDNVKARIQLPDGSYTHVRGDGEPLDAQAYFYEKAYEMAEQRFYSEPPKKKFHFPFFRKK